MVLQWYLWYMVIYVIRYVDTYFDINWYIFIYAYISYQINILPTSTNDRPTNPLVCGMFSTGFHSNARPGHCWRVMRYGSWQNGLLETETQRRTTARGARGICWKNIKHMEIHIIEWTWKWMNMVEPSFNFNIYVKWSLDLRTSSTSARQSCTIGAGFASLPGLREKRARPAEWAAWAAETS